MGAKPKTERARRYWRITLWSVFAMMVSALVLPLSGYVIVGIQAAYAQSESQSNPRADYWRSVRGGSTGYSAVTGRTMDGVVANDEANSLINGSGQNWRQLRIGILANYGGWITFAVLIAIALFYTIRGRVDVEPGISGVRVKRWTGWERLVHWYTAVLFVALAVTGLSLLFGRSILIPILGPKGFSVWATMSKSIHDVTGPAFMIGVALMIMMWLPQNLPEKGDWNWLATGGGIVGKGHPSAGRLNAGEKIWFWFICTVGVATIVTGIILDFPNEWGQTRGTMQLSSLIHGAGALAWILMWVGHAYIGTIGSEGSLDAMSTGYVDVNWAKQHHDLWYNEIKDTAEHVQGPASAAGSAGSTGEEQPAT